MSDENKIDDIKNFTTKFKETHKDYISNFNKFMKNLEKIFGEQDFSNSEHQLLLKWVNEYDNLMNLIQLYFDDFYEQVLNNKKLTLPDKIKTHNENMNYIKTNLFPLLLISSLFREDMEVE